MCEKYVEAKVTEIKVEKQQKLAAKEEAKKKKETEEKFIKCKTNLIFDTASRFLQNKNKYNFFWLKFALNCKKLSFWLIKNY